VTLTAGFAGYNLLMFFVLSVITRGARFFVVAFLLNRYGPQAREVIEKRLGFWVLISVVIIVAGFVIVTRLV
jgi:membrane protein DedA with SNARE-associated domain